MSLTDGSKKATDPDFFLLAFLTSEMYRPTYRSDPAFLVLSTGRSAKVINALQTFSYAPG